MLRSVYALHKLDSFNNQTLTFTTRQNTIETFNLSLFFSDRFHCSQPTTRPQPGTAFGRGMVRLAGVLAVVLLQCLSNPLWAQQGQYRFSRLDIYNGLSHNQVNAVLRDARGFVWVGTMSGLNRYDGYTSKVYRNKRGDTTSLVNNDINALYELPDGKIWVASRDVPCIYDARTDKFGKAAAYNQAMGLPADTLLGSVKGSEGRYWFLYQNAGLYTYEARGGKAQLFRRHGAGAPASRITGFREGARGSIWLVYEDGLLQQVDIRSGKVVRSLDALRRLGGGRYSYRLYADSDDDLWLWTANTPRGLFIVKTKSNTVDQLDEASRPARLNANLITEVIQDGSGLVWVATDHGGINLVDKKKGYAIQHLTNDPQDPRSLSQNSITTLYRDTRGNVWIGTFKQGLNYWNGSTVKFAHYHHRDRQPGSLPYDDVNRFVEDLKGNLWIGTNGGGLVYFDRKANTFTQYLHDPSNPNSISNNVIVSLFIDREDKLWIGSYFGGLSSFNGQRFTHYRHSEADPASLSDDRVWEIFEDRDGRFWVGTLDGGLDLMDRQTGRFAHFRYRGGQPSPLQSNYIAALLQDRKGNLWIGTANGITVFPKGSTRPVHYVQTADRNSLSNNNVISLLEDSKGRIWVGTREGLNLWNEKGRRFEIFTTAQGLPDNAILNILEDSRQHLWVATPNGLCSLVPSEQGGRTSFSVVQYNEANNLQGREFNENAALRLKSGELVFGGPGGFNIIDPARTVPPLPLRPVVFTGLQIFNQDVAVGDTVNGRVLLGQSLPETRELRLKHSENVFSIEFASLIFSQASRERYAYRLQDFNDDWLYTDGSQRRITYTNLDPGHYTFRVKVLNSRGVWSPEQTLAIYIAPPFWRTPLAYTLYMVLVAGLLYLGRRITLDRAHMRFTLLQQRREAERVQELDQLKTRFFTNVSHEFRTPLSLILSPLDRIIRQTSDPEQQKQLNLVHRNAKRLLNLVNQLLDFRKMEVQEIRLYPAIGDMVQFARDITQSFSDISEKKAIGLSFHTNVPELEIYFDKDKIEKILFNLISNAFKYTPDGGKVAVHLMYQAGEEERGTLTLQVKDTGIGIPADKHERIFERFFQNEVPESMVNQGTGIGLAITQEFVRLHNGIITVDSEPDKGTCFTVQIPAYKISTPATAAGAGEELPSGETGEEPETGRNRKKTILLVEDNEDLRFYLKDNLKGLYHVEEAVNGREAWERLKKVDPDLVVSDIMMPLVDGIELARKIKSDTLTAHIPVILLTAMGSEEKQVEGFTIGVNDYITKPFTFEILASRIRNLLAQQQLLQKKFQKQIEVNPSEITVTPLDEQFIKQALEVVEQNIQDPDFSVEDLGREMHLSRAALYKKIVSLTGRAPLEFIRSIRMKRAAQLLEKSGLTVSEVAYQVGFNNPKNFSKYFKEEFKVLPSQYPGTQKTPAS